MNGFKRSSGAVMRTPMRTPMRRRQSGAAVISFVNPWVVTAYNATYATALAAVANGQNFGYIENGTEVAHIYNRASGTAATYLGTIPYKNGVQADQDAIERLRVLGGAASGAKADIFPVDSYYHFLKIKNRALGSTPDLNALGSSRPAMLLGAANMLASSGLTTTVSTAEDGTQSAIRVVSAAGTGHTVTLTFRGLPGLWNYSFRAKTETGSNQTFSAGMGAFSTITVTPTWQDFSLNSAHTTTAATRTLFLASDLAGAAFDVTIDQIRITPGAVSGAASTVDHPFNKSTAPNRVAGYISNSNAVKTNPYIPLSVDNTTTRTAMSVVMAVKKTAANNNIMPFAVEVETSGELNSAPNGGFLFESIGNVTYAGGQNGALSRQMVAVANGDNWMIVGMASGPGGSRLYIDDLVLSVGVTAAWTGFTARLIELLVFRNTAGGFQGNLGSCVVYESELSDADMKTEVARAKSRVALLGETVQVLKNVYISEGDSITAGSGASVAGYAMQVGAGFTPYLQGINFGVINSTLVGALSLQSRQSTVVAKIAEIVASGRRPIVSVNIGANDMVGSITNAAAQYYSDLCAYWAALRTAGAYVCASTVLPQQSLTGPQETARLAMNALIRGDSSKWDALADFANDAAFVGGWSSTYFGDTAHPKDAGHTAMGAVVIAAITPLVLT